MRLLSLTTRNFRGFGPAAIPLSLDADLILLYGPNGYGKTSLAEAIEWLLFGTTRRRQRGDTYSKNEFEGCFPNAHKGTPVEVSATICTSSGQHTLTRRIPDPQNDLASETFVNGTKSSFAPFGLAAGLGMLSPVVAQHDLQSLIHSRPKDRRDIISTALGLEELTALKTALDGARRSFTIAPPKGVKDARAKIQEIGLGLSSIRETTLVSKRWMKATPEIRATDDAAGLISAGQRLADSEAADAEKLLNDLRLRRQQLSKTVFDTEHLITASDFDAGISRVASTVADVARDSASLAGHLAKAMARKADTYATALLQFWEAGLKLSHDDVKCPMCEEETFNTSKRDALRERLLASQQAISIGKELTAAIASASTSLLSAKRALDHVSVQGLNEKQRTLLTSLFAKEPKQLAAFLTAHDAMRNSVDASTNTAKQLEHFLASLPQRVSDTQSAEAIIADSTAMPSSFAAEADRFQNAIASYKTAWSKFEPVLASEIASNAAIAQIDAVGKGLAATAELRILAAYDAITAASLTTMKNAEAFLQAKQTSLLRSRGAEIKGFYDALNPGASVGFEGMEPANEQLRLHATSFGIRMSAAANLSACQLNCLGLSFWIGQATTTTSPFEFIVLDDPVQSMDDDHCEAFIATLIPLLFDTHKKQVILLSHERKLIDRVRDLNKSRDTVVYHYDLYDVAGPSITEQVNLAVMLGEVKGLARGNEANRKAAVDKLRGLCEEFIRGLHLQLTGQPAPPKYDNATPGELLDLFKFIPGTTPDEHRRLKDTADFSAPAHHQPMGYNVPTTPNIMIHISRMETFLKQHKLIH